MSHCALLAEPDHALRDLMHRSLVAAGYEVVDSSNLLQVEVGLRVSAVCGARNALFIFGARLAAQCSPAICAAARVRARAGLPPAQVILTFEFGTLATMPRPELAPCITRGTLEKPFDLLELQGLAAECWHRTMPSKAGGAVAVNGR